MHPKYFYVVFYKNNTDERYKTPMFGVDVNDTIVKVNSLKPFYNEFNSKNKSTTILPEFMKHLFKLSVDVDNAQEKVRSCNGFDYVEYNYFVNVTYDMNTGSLLPYNQ